MIASPVDVALKKIIHFDKRSVVPVYIQIAQQLSIAIQRGYLAVTTPMPGTRSFSQLFKIHRNTAVAVYNELASQGWVEIIPNKGTFILNPASKTPSIKAPSVKSNEIYTYSKTTGFKFQASFHLAPTREFTTQRFIINDGHPDLRLHPTQQFSKWFSAAMKRKALVSKWNPVPFSEPSAFEKQLCNFLNVTRGFHCTPINVMNTRSTEMSLYIISQLLIQPKEVVLVAEWGNYAANMIFQQAKAIIKTVPSDAQGMDVEFLEKNYTKGSIRCVYVCSNRAYPTTKMLSPERRMRLMQLAKIYDFAIIEDDYDFDFQFDGTSVLPMASADTSGRVIYLGKIGQSFFPSFQTGFVVAPENLITVAKNYLQMLDRQGDLIQEQLLSDLIYEGEIHRLIKKNVTIYKHRRDFLCRCLTENFKQQLVWEKPTGGLALWLQFEPKIALVQLAKEAAKIDLFLPKSILYQDKNTCAIRFGFAHLNEEEMEQVVLKLKTAHALVVKK